MPIELSLVDSGKYQYVRVSGPITPEISHQIALRTEAFADETGVKSVLFDLRDSRNVSSVAENYDLAYKELEELDIKRSTKAALLLSPDDCSHDYVVIALRNAGYNARKFIDVVKAEEWLEADAA